MQKNFLALLIKYTSDSGLRLLARKSNSSIIIIIIKVQDLRH